MSTDVAILIWALCAFAAVLVGMRYKRPLDDVLGAALLGPFGLALLYYRGHKREREAATPSTGPAPQQRQP